MFVHPHTARGVEKLVPMASPGPWSGVSAIIGYRGKIWFVNSNPFVDHNSADIYSYDPATGRARFEKHLFSQDVGRPAVANGLLYWPFEDARFSVGRGEYMVTDGREWQWRIVPNGEVFHIHAMLNHHGGLYAATLARWYLLWGAGLTGYGHVPLEYLSQPFNEKSNRSEKYLYLGSAAAWTVARLRQNSRKTIAALIHGLGRKEQPLWIDGDYVGALTDLTRQRFGYDLAAWRGWWFSQFPRRSEMPITANEELPGAKIDEPEK